MKHVNNQEKVKNKEENKDISNVKKVSINKINIFLNKKTDFKVYELILFAVLIMIVSVFLTVVIMQEANLIYL